MQFVVLENDRSKRRLKRFSLLAGPFPHTARHVASQTILDPLPAGSTRLADA
jgi:hypothetical protein